MTPSKRLNTNFKIFKTLVGDVYKNKTLHKGSPKYDPFGGVHGRGSYSKGVKSDQLFIFKPKEEKKEFISFSFVFDFLDKPEEEHSISVIIKPIDINKKWDESDEDKASRYNLNKQMENSKFFSVNEFRLLLNAVNKELTCHQEQGYNINEDVVIELLKKHFMGEKISLEQVAEKAQTEINFILKRKINKFKRCEKDVLLTEEELNAAKKKVNTSLKRTKEYKELLELEARQKELNTILERKENQFNKKNDVDGLSEKLNKLKKEKRKLSNELDKEKEELIEHQPSIIRSRLK